MKHNTLVYNHYRPPLLNKQATNIFSQSHVGKYIDTNETNKSLMLLYAFRDLWKEWGDSNFHIFFFTELPVPPGGWSRWNTKLCFFHISI